MKKQRKHVLWGIELKGGGLLVHAFTSRKEARGYMQTLYQPTDRRIVRLEVIQRPQRKGGGA